MVFVLKARINVILTLGSEKISERKIEKTNVRTHKTDEIDEHLIRYNSL